MATNTLSQNINQAISDFNGIKQAIIDKGVEVPIGTKTSEYGDKISQIQTGGGSTPEKGFLPTEFDSNGYPTKGTLYGMTEVPNYYFYNYRTTFGHFIVMLNIIFENDITSIGNYAFYNCTNLALTSLPNGLTSIGYYAFSGCTNLALTSLPNGLTSIDYYTFSYCKNLALALLPNELTSIDSFAFYNCTNLALTSLPSGVTSIGNNAFQNCVGLTTMYIDNAIQTITTSSFQNCKNLTSITINRAEGKVTGAPWGAVNASIYYVGDS